MWRRKRSRPSSRRRLTKNVNRFSSGICVCSSAIGVVEEHRLSTNGPGSAAPEAAPAPAAAVPASPAAVRATAPAASFGVGVINFSPAHSIDRDAAPVRQGRIRSTSGGVRAFARCARSWQPRRHRNPSFRPVALRPRLSTGLPLSTRVQCQSVADFSQALNSCLDSQIGHPCHGTDTRNMFHQCLGLATVALKFQPRTGRHAPNACENRDHQATRTRPPHHGEARARSGRRRHKRPRDSRGARRSGRI